MQNFTVKISLNDDEMEGVKRLNELIKESVPDLFGDYTLEDTVGFVARSGFAKVLQNLICTYQNNGKEEGVNE